MTQTEYYAIVKKAVSKGYSTKYDYKSFTLTDEEMFIELCLLSRWRDRDFTEVFIHATAKTI